MTTPIKLVVGLGNPGPEYEATRHNAGEWWVRQLAEVFGASWSVQAKFYGAVAKVDHADWRGMALVPTTFMNRSGQAVAALAKFYKITPQEILVAHDELDLPAGAVRLKQGGGHGGHNGLRDITHHIGAEFWRLRVGIGHPGHKSQVTNYVLHAPSRVERDSIDTALTIALNYYQEILAGDMAKVMNQLHAD